MKKVFQSLLVVAAFSTLFLRAQTEQNFLENSDIVGSYFAVIPPTANVLGGTVVEIGIPPTPVTNYAGPYVMSGLMQFDMTFNTLGYHEGESSAGVLFVDGIIYPLEGSFLVQPFPTKNTTITYDIRAEIPIVNGPTITAIYTGVMARAPKKTAGLYLSSIQYRDTQMTLSGQPDDDAWFGLATFPLYIEASKSSSEGTVRTKIYR